MGTFIVLVILILITGLAVRKLYRDKKNGISLQCGVKCDHCGGGCGACGGCGTAAPGSKK